MSKKLKAYEIKSGLGCYITVKGFKTLEVEYEDSECTLGLRIPVYDYVSHNYVVFEQQEKK